MNPGMEGLGQETSTTTCFHAGYKGNVQQLKTEYEKTSNCVKIH